MGQVKEKTFVERVKSELRSYDLEPETVIEVTSEMIAEDIRNSLWTCPTHGDPDYHNDCLDCTDALAVNVIINNILSLKSLK